MWWYTVVLHWQTDIFKCLCHMIDKIVINGNNGYQFIPSKIGIFMENYTLHYTCYRFWVFFDKVVLDFKPVFHAFSVWNCRYRIQNNAFHFSKTILGEWPSGRGSRCWGRSSLFLYGQRKTWAQSWMVHQWYRNRRLIHYLIKLKCFLLKKQCDHSFFCTSSTETVPSG